MKTITQVIDPVCGMALESYDVALLREYDGRTYSFCSPVCREQFDRDPGQYTRATPPLEYARVAVVGLPCAAEASRLERRLTKINGIVRVTVNPVTEEAYLTFDPSHLSLADVKSIVANACAAFR